jgi:hypothetical protein
MEKEMPSYFAFDQESPGGEMNEFVFEILDPMRIIEAREILGNPNNLKRHVQGTIVPGKKSYNPNWSFHLDPETIRFFEMSMEVCDANVTWVEEHLDEIGDTALPGMHWCPWSSNIGREIL